MEDESARGNSINQSFMDNAPSEQGLSSSFKQKTKQYTNFLTKKKGGKSQMVNKRERQTKEGDVDKANSYFSCECQVCKQQITKGQKFEVKKSLNLEILQGKKIPFAQLIEYMLPPNDKVKGCQVLFTDTVFFAHGKPQFIARNDKEGCMIIVTQLSKLALQDIRQRFSTIVRERKKETQLILFNTSTNGPGTPTHRRSPSDDREQHNQQSVNDEKSIYYKDTAVIRFVDDDVVKVVRDTEFINEFRRRANDDFWKTLSCIQTAVKAKTGIGHPIFLNFYAPINEEKPNDDINYERFKTMDEDVDILRSGDTGKYAYKQCLRIAYYISKVYNQEILQMKTVFLKDENGNLWFFYAQNIQIRQAKNRLLSGYDLGTKKFQAQTKDQLLREIDQYEKDANGQQTKSISRVLNVMNNYYQNMKGDMGLAEPQNFEVDDSQLDEVLLKLKPNTTASNFKDFLLRSDTMNMTRQKWRSNSRQNIATRTQVSQDINPMNEQIKQFMQKRNHGSMKTQYENINTLFKQQFTQNLNRSQNIMSREREYMTKKANFKSELVRNELINRKIIIANEQPLLYQVNNNSEYDA